MYSATLTCIPAGTSASDVTGVPWVSSTEAATSGDDLLLGLAVRSSMTDEESVESNSRFADAAGSQVLGCQELLTASCGDLTFDPPSMTR